VIKLVTIHIPKLYYGGIDESNHGKVPEVYSLVLSSDPTTIIRNEKILSKKRKLLPKSKDIYKKLEYFKYLLLEEKIIKILGQNALKSTVIAHLLANADINPRRVKILVDGFLQSTVIDEASKIYYNLTNKRIHKRKILSIEHGDQWYPIINSADLLSYIIYKNLNKKGNLPSKDKLVELPLELRC